LAIHLASLIVLHKNVILFEKDILNIT